MHHITALAVPVRTHRTIQYGSLAGFTAALYCGTSKKSQALQMCK